MDKINRLSEYKVTEIICSPHDCSLLQCKLIESNTPLTVLHWCNTIDVSKFLLIYPGITEQRIRPISFQEIS